MDSFNPHKESPVASNLYCWRIGNTRSWAKAVYETDTKALEAAKEHCKNRLGVGKYTIHIGVTKTEPVNCEPIIKRYKQHQNKSPAPYQKALFVQTKYSNLLSSTANYRKPHCAANCRKLESRLGFY